MEIYTLELSLDKKPRENKKRINDFLDYQGFENVLICPTDVEKPLRVLNNIS